MPPDPSLTRLPAFRPGMRIGLFGGSFDPPHEGHRQVSLAALSVLGLDQVWWLVSPHNPLKPNAPSEDLARRVAAARACAAHPRIKVTAIEAALHTTYTAETLRHLSARLRQVKAVWMMGADNLRQFHHWRDWQRIAGAVPIAVFNRPGEMPAALSCRSQGPARWQKNGRPPGFSCRRPMFRSPRPSFAPIARLGQTRLESFTVTRISLASRVGIRAGARERGSDTDHRTAQ